MAIDKDALDQFLVGRDPQELFAKDGLLDELQKGPSERMPSAELDDHPESESESAKTQPIGATPRRGRRC